MIAALEWLDNAGQSAFVILLYINLFGPFGVCAIGIAHVFLVTIVMCVMDYADIMKDIGFVILLRYISEEIIVSNNKTKGTLVHERDRD